MHDLSTSLGDRSLETVGEPLPFPTTVTDGSFAHSRRAAAGQAKKSCTTVEPGKQTNGSYGRNDSQKAIDLEGRAADQCSVDIGLGKQIAGVLGLDTTAVLNPH